MLDEMKRHTIMRKTSLHNGTKIPTTAQHKNIEEDQRLMFIYESRAITHQEVNNNCHQPNNMMLPLDTAILGKHTGLPMRSNSGNAGIPIDERKSYVNTKPPTMNVVTFAHQQT